MWNKKQYDIVIVGAGPAGTTFARIAARSGLSVLLLEKKSQIGVPVRCGEGVIGSGLRLFHEPRPEWIATTIDEFSFVSPNGSSTNIIMQEKGYILNRKVFDYDLAKFAEDAGATVITNANVNGLLIDNDMVIGVKGLCNSEPFEIKSKLVIGADGVESRIGRFAGINTKLGLSNIDSGFQKTISGIDVDRNVCSFYISNELAPGGYIWIFPKGNDSANIGIGISGKAHIKGKSAKTRLNEFLYSKYPNHKVESISVGGIPLSQPIKQMVTDSVMLIGDAARTVNPLSGGGIILGMKSAVKAVDVAIKILKSGKEPTKINLMDYQKRWMNSEGKQINRIYRIKTAVDKLTDRDLNNIIEKVNKLPVEKRSLARIFRA
ncbi:MAG: NAD(P)/FAD-dependent oxidoreductase, partial [Candidatus Marinimicrobia bacterium]|nr:NAD(P)/FAD-dependent oxidoreductase [Candidatus Neomarinimicrobiota bacterium]